jgi:hypothetical protein
MSETGRKRLIVKGPGGFEKAVGWIKMPPKGAKGGDSRKKNTGSVTQGQTFEMHEVDVQVQEEADTRSEAGGAKGQLSEVSSVDEPIVKPTKGIRSSKKRKKGEMEMGEGAVGGTAALGEAEAAIGGTVAEVGLKLVQHKGSGARGRRRESGSRPSKKRREQERGRRRL